VDASRDKPVRKPLPVLSLRLPLERRLPSLYFDYRYQYALGIENFEKERICINTLTNFRQRLVEYEVETGIDLLKSEVDELSAQLADLIKLDKSMARMDSFLLSSSCKKLSRLELRAGVEGIVSALRRGFKIDDIPVRGLVRSKIWIHSKILAYNFKAVAKSRAKIA